jgi:hypothetical protein
MQMSIRLCDTQIISYAINSHQRLPSSDVAISSATAQELLLVQGVHSRGFLQDWRIGEQSRMVMSAG